MRYSTVLKFIAFVLCAATLLGMVGTAAGIVFLTELGGKSVEEAYQDRLYNQSAGYAMSVGGLYLSETLGGAPRNLANDHFGWQSQYFADAMRVGYTLRDSEGNVLTEWELHDNSSPIVFEEEIPVTGNYMKVVTTVPREESQTPEENTAGEEHRVLVMPSQEMTEIGTVYLDYTDGSRNEIRDKTVVGWLYRHSDTVVFETNRIDGIPMGDGWYVNHIVLADMGGNIVYEAWGDTHVILGMEESTNQLVLTLPAGTVTTAAPVGVTYTDGEYTSYDAIPLQGVTVTGMNVSYANAQGEVIGSEGVSSADFIGTLFHDAQGNAVFHSKDPMMMDIPDGHSITSVTFMDAQSNALFEANCPSGVGTIRYDEKGCLIFQGQMPGTTVPEETVPEATEATQAPEEKGQIGFAMEELTLYSAPSSLSEELGSLTAWQEVTILRQDVFNGERWGLTEAGWIPMEKVLLSEMPRAVSEETVPEETAAAEPSGETEAATEPVQAPKARTVTEAAVTAAVPETTEESIPPETETYPADKTETGYYYDSEQRQEMEAGYLWEPIPAGYTMTIRLAQGAMRGELGWTLLRLAEAFRHLLLEVLGACIAVFALCVVHLSCSAGRTRRNNEVRAGGLNRIPLDLYLAAGALAESGLLFAAVEGSEYFARNDQQLAIVFCGACAYLACLLLVGFCFAFVAQVKTPGGFWWRNSLCGRCMRLLVHCGRELNRLGGACWKNGRPLAGQGIRGIWRLGKKSVLWLWDTGRRLGSWTAAMLGKCLNWMGGKLARFFGLLPITWQFLLTGFTMVFLLYVVLRSYKVGWILVGFGIFFATILYAASAFAILLENAKRMSKGDLDAKVNDRMLIGGFKDFAGELNALADVAVVAAQKQLKSERMKTELITNVSHDIKTPLTSIINYVDLLQKPHTEAEQTQYLEVLERQSQRLKKLIDDLMEMSKASTGNMAVEITRMDAAEAVNQALGEFADKLERAQLIPVFRQPEEQVDMMADGRLVWRVMSNLLGNAVKYALPGTRIYVDLMKVESKVIISMKNISREELNVHADELLERFVRGDASRNTEGSGLGLNIAQSLMELQKGQLQILVDGDLFKVTLIFPAA